MTPSAAWEGYITHARTHLDEEITSDGSIIIIIILFTINLSLFFYHTQNKKKQKKLYLRAIFAPQERERVNPTIHFSITLARRVVKLSI